MREVWLCHSKLSIFLFNLHPDLLMPSHRSIICNYFTQYEPDLLPLHKVQCLRHCCFWAAGVNDIWAVDQHDKWLQFGLALHTSIEPFSGKILWIHVWHSNHNPQLILTYYLAIVEQYRCKYSLFIEIYSLILISFHRYSIGYPK